MRNMLSVFFVCALIFGMLTGCKSSDVIGVDKTVTLRLAHNHNEEHPIHKSLLKFSKDVEKKPMAPLKCKCIQMLSSVQNVK